jgi:hypothetical protein
MGFWIQTEITAKGGLTFPNPKEDAPLSINIDCGVFTPIVLDLT